MANSSFVSIDGTLIETNIPATDRLKPLSRGKVRDLYIIESEETEGAEEQLLFVATDRVSAFDVVLKNVRY